ncbi:MAG: potassium channel protein [Spirochaetales bacterium]|nr:potassium channel protein [Spirochaetales bacterium]
MRRHGVRVFSAVILLVGLVGGGTAAYRIIEGWPLTESLYMAIITLTTVGFGEVRPLSPAGRHFTILFLLLSVATVGYSLSTVISYLFEGQIVSTMRERRMRRELRRIKNHYIVCGAGDVGREVVQEFLRAGTPFVVIERDPEHSEISYEGEALCIPGDASEETVLTQAHIEDAAGLVAVLPSDADNVFVTLTARQMNPNLTIIAKGTDYTATAKLRRAGADRVVTPAKIAGRRIASSILRPSVVNFLDVIVDDSEMSMRMEEFPVHTRSLLAGKTLREAEIGSHTGAIVLAIADGEGRARTDASRTGISSISIRPGDHIIGLGSDEQLRELEKLVRGA